MREMAKQAAGELFQMFGDFPFSQPVDRAVWMASVLTMVMRRTIDCAPLFYVTGEPGSGKTTLIRATGRVVFGSEVCTLLPSEDNIQAALRTGVPMVVLDGFDGGRKAHDALAKALTSPSVVLRKPYKSTTETVPSSATWWAAGTNPALSDDLRRRTLFIDLGERTPDVIKAIVDARPFESRYASEAALRIATSIVGAWTIAGAPDPEPVTWGSFELWSKTVVPIVKWLGIGDPLARRLDRLG